MKYICGIPNIARLMNSSFVNVKHPSRSIQQIYHNKKKHPGIYNWMIITANRCFIKGSLGWSSFMHDASMFRKSLLG